MTPKSADEDFIFENNKAAGKKWIIANKIYCIFLCACLAVLTEGCNGFSNITYRYRMTVSVDTPWGIRSGSSVIEVSVIPTIGPSSNAFSTRLRGQAVVIDLPKNKRIFALLSAPSGSDAAVNYAPLAYGNVLNKTGNWIDFLKSLKDRRDVATLPEKNYPTIATFKFPKEFKSIDIINSDNISQKLGYNAKISSVKISITEDEITNNIRKFVPEYENDRDFRKWLLSMEFSDPRRVTMSSFREGI